MITIIGIISLILSIIAFFKSEKWLLKLVIFFSVFTAAIAFSKPVTILPFEIPMVLLLLKYLINYLKNDDKKSLKDITCMARKNKVFTIIFIFAIALTASELWLAFSKLDYTYYDELYKEIRTIKLSSFNINQYCRHMLYLIFAMIISLKIKGKDEIKEYLRVFCIASIFAISWGFVQLLLYSIGVKYPAFLFNNNPYAAQGYNQIIFNLNRINSIALEPSTFAINVAVFLPFVLIPFIIRKKDFDTKKLLILSMLGIACGLLTFSSTIILAFLFQFIILFIVIICNKNKEKFKRFSKTFLIAFLGILSTFIICISFMYVRKMVEYKRDNTIIDKKDHDSTDKKDDNKDEKEKHKSNNDEIETEDIISSFIEVTINKLSSGSAKERLGREVDGLEIYTLSPVFGVGISSFRTFTLFTNVLVNVGLLGLMSIICLFFTVIKVLIKNYKNDREMSLIFLFSIIGMLIAFIFSVPDLTYIYCWVIIVFAYNYFTFTTKEKIGMNKEEIIIGVDARSLDENRTGISTYIVELLEKFNDLYKNKKVKFYLYSSRKINLDFKPNSNIVLKECTNFKRGVVFLRYKLPKMLKEDNVSIFWGTQHLLPKRNRYTRNMKYVLTVHDLAIHKFKTVGSRKNTIVQKLFLKRSCRDADKIIADSKSTKNDLIEMFNIPDEKIKVVYLGASFDNNYNISKNKEKEILTKYDVVNNDYLFFVSTIEPRKNIITLVKAFEELKQHNNKLKLILAGGLGWKYEEIVSTIDNSSYKEDINLAGYITREEKECLMHNCKCLVYPSLYEGFGLPVLEAMAKGTIVVTSNNSSLPEVGGNAALYYDNVFDYNELAKTIEKVLKMNDKNKNIIIDKGYKQSNKFTWEKCAKETMEALVDVSEV